MKFSIIVPIYNAESTLTKCFESINKQTYKNIEIVLVDDGSTDKSLKMCKDFEKYDKRVKVIHQKNNGISSARNSGIKNSNGEWIIFLDSDDMLESDACEILKDTIKEYNNKIEIINYCFYKTYLGKIKEIDNSTYFEMNKIYNNQQQIEYIKNEILNLKSNIASVWSKAYKSEFIKKNNIYFDEKLTFAEDMEYLCRVLSYYPNVVFIKKILYMQTYSKYSATSFYKEENMYSALESFEKIECQLNMKSAHSKTNYYNALLSNIVSAFISGFFNPANKMSRKEKKRKISNYLSQPKVKEALKNIGYANLDFSRKFICYCIIYRKYNILYAIGKIRYLEKNRKAKNDIC